MLKRRGEESHTPIWSLGLRQRIIFSGNKRQQLLLDNKTSIITLFS